MSREESPAEIPHPRWLVLICAVFTVALVSTEGRSVEALLAKPSAAVTSILLAECGGEATLEAEGPSVGAACGGSARSRSARYP